MENQTTPSNEKKRGDRGLKPRTDRGLSLKPSTSIKREHRSAKTKLSLKAFAQKSGSAAANEWLRNKGVSQ